MRKLLSFLLALVFLLSGFLMPISKIRAATSPSYGWTKTFGSADVIDEVEYITFDSVGNMYFTGYFSGTTDFDPGPSVDSHTTNGAGDIYLSKYNADGSYAWTKTWGGSSATTDVSYEVETDSSNNVYVVGYYAGTVDFDPGVGTVSHTSAGSSDHYISKFDTNGNLIWNRVWGSSGADQVQAILITGSTIYLTGKFRGTEDFDPGAGTENHTAAGDYDAYLAKYDTDGTFYWAKTWGSTNKEEANDIVQDTSGNLYVVGNFFLTVDFDPGAGTDNHTSNGGYDVYLSKFTSDGTFVWAKTFGGNVGDDLGMGMTIDANNNIYIDGLFSDSPDFDPGTGVDTHSSNGGLDVFLAKYDTSGNFIWAKTFGGTGGEGANKIAIDSANNTLYIVGNIVGSVDMDPGSGSDVHFGFGSSGDSYISEFDLNGNFNWSKTFGAKSDNPVENAEDVTIHNGDIYFVGYFVGPDAVNFDTFGGTDLHTATGNSWTDIFVTKYVNGPQPVSQISPKDWGLDTRPWLDFRKTTDTEGIRKYTVFLDRAGPLYTYVAGDIAPGGGCTTPLCVWKDTNDYQIAFVNENDTNPLNDEIRVYFKGLTATPLLEGSHNWVVEALDGSGNTTSSTTNFMIDNTAPLVTNLLTNKGSTINAFSMNLSLSSQTAVTISGTAVDYYHGSPAVASGPDKLSLLTKKGNKSYTNILKSFQTTEIKDNPGVSKTAPFSLLIPVRLLVGMDSANLILSDKAGNSFTTELIDTSAREKGQSSLPSDQVELTNKLAETPSKVLPEPAPTPKSVPGTEAPQPTQEPQVQESLINTISGFFNQIAGFLKNILNQ